MKLSWAFGALSLWLGAIGSAHATSGCTIAPGAQIAFGPVVALASTGDVDSNSGSSLVVQCAADVALPPSLYSSSPRRLSGPGGDLPFRLSLDSPGGLELADASPGSPLSVPSDGIDHVVPLHARLRAADFASLPAGNYAASITLTIEY